MQGWRVRFDEAQNGVGLSEGAGVPDPTELEDHSLVGADEEPQGDSPPGEDADVLVTQAVLALRGGRSEEALSLAERALERAPGHLGAYLACGEAQARLGDRVGAQSSFRKWVRRAPEFALGEHLLKSVGGRGFDAPLRNEISELFDRYASSFDAHLIGELGYRGHKALPEAVAEIAEVSDPQWTVVDLGCGTGLCGLGLRPLARWLVGVDVSPAILDEARQRNIYDTLFVADLVWALASSADASADLIVAADVLGYLGELKAVFQEARRVLRPGGRVAFTVEALAGETCPYRLGDGRHFAFSQGYLRSLGEGWIVERLDQTALRREGAQPVGGWLAVWRVA